MVVLTLFYQMVSRNARASNAWHKVNVWPQFKLNLIWRLGNGQMVNIWIDHRILGVNWLRNLTMDLEGGTLNLKVVDYVKEDGAWNLDKLGSMLSLDCLEILFPIKAFYPTVRDDRLAWVPEINGDFSLFFFDN